MIEWCISWNGLLVESNPRAVSALRSKQRKSWLSANCVCPSDSPHLVEFDSTLIYGGVVNSRSDARPGDMAHLASQRPGFRPIHSIDEESPGGLRVGRHRVQCLPLGTMLLALGVDTVHYLVLDVEGAELPVLETFPWDKIDVKVIQVEMAMVGKIFAGSTQRLRNLFKRSVLVFLAVL